MSELLSALAALETLSAEERVKRLKDILAELQQRINYTPPIPVTPRRSFLERHPWLNLMLSLLLTGLVVFCDCFVGVATILSGLLTASVGILVLSIGFASILMTLVVLLQLSALSEKSTLSWLQPPQSIYLQMEEYKLLEALNNLMSHGNFVGNYRLNKITHSEYQALENLILERSRVIGATAECLEKKNKSKLVVFCKASAFIILGLSNAASGFSIGYFFAAALSLCFQSLFIPVWLPLALGGLLGTAVLLMFYDTQRDNVFRMVERGFGCDKSWIESMTKVMIQRCSSEMLMSMPEMARASAAEREMPVPPVVARSDPGRQGFYADMALFFATERMKRLAIIKGWQNEQDNLQRPVPALSV